ncbi:hypothetical protein [Ottowia caeni]|uniref:hypothetical protein n=1 Tax=Ottowia caeni TaxID=2870339 RepID=UPI001E4E4186|nr:hypothetical protein [Ottowia caeni]
MASKAIISLLGAGWAVCAWAQPLTENAAKPLSSTGETLAQRSAIWTAVHSLQRGSLGESAPALRRLSPTERLELREQIRRAAAGESFTPDVSEGRLPQPQLLPVRQ